MSSLTVEAPKGFLASALRFQTKCNGIILDKDYVCAFGTYEFQILNGVTARAFATGVSIPHSPNRTK